MPEPNTAELARHIAEFYAPLAEREGLQINAALNEKVVIRGNPQLLSQVFANLLDNAIEHTKAPGNGLGLVATVARIHGASLSLEDGDPGRLVRFSFPRLAEAA